MKRFQLPNKLTLLLLENHRLPIVAAQAYVRNVSLWEPENQVGVATMTGYMLDEGTARHKTGQEIAELIENVGGMLGFSSSGGSVKVLAPNRKLGIGLLFESLSEANFPRGGLRTQPGSLAGGNQRRRVTTGNQGRNRVPPDGLWGASFRPAHAWARQCGAKLTPKDCAAFYQRSLCPRTSWWPLSATSMLMKSPKKCRN